MASEVPNYTVRLMAREEIPAVLDLWRDTQMSEGSYTVHTWFDYDPGGFYVAVTDDNTVIGACAGVKQDEDMFFMGLYVVKSEFRRRGIGRKVWNAVMTRIGGRNAGVNPIPEQLENYRDRSGFPTQSNWRSIICKLPEIDLSLFTFDVPDVRVLTLLPDGEETIRRAVQYDTDVVGFDRGDLLRLLCAQKESITMVAIRTTDNVICGYGNIKLTIKEGTFVAPLYADNSEIAEKVLYELIKAFPGAESNGLRLPSIDCNRAAIDMVEKLGFKQVYFIPRLYRKEEREVKYESIFALHNLNFSIF